MDPDCIQSKASSARRICKYDVFLSFRGTDSRSNFTDHLYDRLNRKGIVTFKDDKRLEKGEPISSQLLQAIRDSRVSIVVFSEDYAGSTWCLDEMAAIVDCQSEFEQTVFPVFCGVDPSHVRNQKRSYEDAFALHAEKFKDDPGKVDRWRRAMRDLGNLVGWDLRGRSESKEIEKIVQKVIKTLNHKFSGFVDDLIGIQPRVEMLEKLLQLSSKDDDFRVLGIWGMGGIGKTTQATVLYDRISYRFDVCCFIENVSKIYKDGGAMAVQKQILRQTLNEKNLDSCSTSETSGIITNRLYNLKVLVVLDNVDQYEQLQDLAINPKLLGAGSRIIITTRDKDIFKVYEADEVHEVPLLNNGDARELLLTKAFKSRASSSSFEQLISEVLHYAQRLPLVIKVIGSFLCTRDVVQWRDALNRMRGNPDNKIMGVLRVSFEGLQSDEKEIFLHIACFFKGERVDYVKRILNACGLYPHIGIAVIAEKSLITLRNEEIHMHDMLQELGKTIVRRQFPGEPKLWSRLWLYQDFYNVLMTETETINVKAIVLDQKEEVPKFGQLRAAALSKMRDLRLLILYQKNFTGCFKFLPNNLQYFLWHGYPFASLPLTFEPYNNLVELSMPDSSIQRLWEGRKRFPHLKRMDLSNSKYLAETPNFEWSPSLVRLDFTGCANLRHVHRSIGLLQLLAYLSLRNCTNLVSLDLDTQCKLCSLRVLHLSGCTNLKSTPDFRGLLNLEYLDLENCSSLSTVHESIGALQLLKFLSLKCCTNLDKIPSSINNMSSLLTLDLSDCGKLGIPSLEKFPLNPGIQVPSLFLKSLIFLDLGFCNMRHIPSSFEGLECLERLNIEGNNLVSLPSMSGIFSLAYLNVSHCKNLQYTPQISSKSSSSVGRYFGSVSGSRNHRSGFYAFDCPQLIMNLYLDMHLVITEQRYSVSWLLRLAQEPRHFRSGFDIVVPGTIIPLWFNHEFDPGSIIRVVDSDANDNWIGFAFCVAFDMNYHLANSGSSPYSFSTQSSHPLYLSFESEHTEECFHMPPTLKLGKIQGSRHEHIWLIYISRVHCHFVKTGARITFKTHSGLNISKWGLRMVFKQDIEGSKGKINIRGGSFLEKRLKAPNMKEKEEKLKLVRKTIEAKERELEKVAMQDVEAKERKQQIITKLKTKEMKMHSECIRMLRDSAHSPFVYVSESCSSSEPKIQLPYNWLVTEEDENEKMEAKHKENNISNLGL